MTDDIIERFYIIYKIPINFLYSILFNIMQNLNQSNLMQSSHDICENFHIEQATVIKMLQLQIQFPEIPLFSLYYCFMLLGEYQMRTFLRFCSIHLSIPNQQTYETYKKYNKDSIILELLKSIKSGDELEKFVLLFKYYFLGK